MLRPAIKVNALYTEILARFVPPLLEILGTELVRQLPTPGLPVDMCRKKYKSGSMDRGKLLIKAMSSASRIGELASSFLTPPLDGGRE
jgi:hypothetical protein